MAGNPLIDQGTLNRIRGSILIPGTPTLNVTAPFLGKAGISLGLQGDSTLMIPTMTGLVTSPEPYMTATVTLNLLKTQNLAALYKARMEDDARLGSLTIIPDATTFPSYELLNTAIQSIREMSFAGEDAGFVVMIVGAYNTNAKLFEVL